MKRRDEGSGRRSTYTTRHPLISPHFNFVPFHFQILRSPPGTVQSVKHDKHTKTLGEEEQAPVILKMYTAPTNQGGAGRTCAAVLDRD